MSGAMTRTATAKTLSPRGRRASGIVKVQKCVLLTYIQSVAKEVDLVITRLHARG